MKTKQSIITSKTHVKKMSCGSTSRVKKLNQIHVDLYAYNDTPDDTCQHQEPENNQAENDHVAKWEY